MKREVATAFLDDLLRRIASGTDRYLNLVDSVTIFGSYARGALNPGDLDMAVERDSRRDREIFEWELERSLSGRPSDGPMRQAIYGRRRFVSCQFADPEYLKMTGIDPVIVLWRRGDALDEALARLHAIAPDPAAGRAPRDHMLPAFEGIEHLVPRPARIMFVPAVEAGALSIERVEVPAGRVARLSPYCARYLSVRWVEHSPRRRVGVAALCWVADRGGDPKATWLDGDPVDAIDTPHYVGFGWGNALGIPFHLGERGGQEWLVILRPLSAPPYVGLRFVPIDRDFLRTVRLYS